LDERSEALSETVADTSGGGSTSEAPAGGASYDRYRIGRELARGGMGRIVAARDDKLGRDVAIKEALDASESVLARFRREALITARLQHPSIIPIYEVGQRADGQPFYVMRLVHGMSLEAAIERRRTFRDRLDLLAHMSAAADAMAYAHDQRIIHRDLKPANVLVGEFGETVVIDWGLAKDLETSEPEIQAGPFRTATAAGVTEDGAIMGTPLYMPPEQARGEPLDPRADVYSLGAMLHHVLAGEPPFGGATLDAVLVKVMSEAPRALPDEIPPDLRAIVVKAMARRAEDRYPTARELAKDLRDCLAGRLVDAHQYSSAQLATRWLQRPWVPIALLVVLALTIFGGIGWLLHEHTLRTQAEQRAGTLDQR